MSDIAKSFEASLAAYQRLPEAKKREFDKTMGAAEASPYRSGRPGAEEDDMSDIVERLRTALFDPYGKEAADEITRLRRQRDTAREALHQCRVVAEDHRGDDGKARLADISRTIRRTLAALDGEDQTDG